MAAIGGLASTDLDPTASATVELKRLSSWRTGDVPLWRLAVGCPVAAVAAIASAATGSWLGVLAAALIMAAEVALVVIWAGAPMEPRAE